MTTIVLVHGAWAASWVWKPVVGPLEASGFDVIAVDLPGTPGWSGAGAEISLAGNVRAVIGALEGVTGDIVLVGHSGGGITITAVAEAIAPRLSGLVFVAGMMLPSGTGFAQLCAEIAEVVPPPVGVQAFLESVDNGEATVVPPEVAVATFFQRASPGDAETASRMLAPQANSGRAMVAEWTPARAGSVRRLYIEALDDRSVPLALQRHMQARTPGAQVVTLDSDHAPQLSATEDLVAAIVEFAGGATN